MRRFVFSLLLAALAALGACSLANAPEAVNTGTGGSDTTGDSTSPAASSSSGASCVEGKACDDGLSCTEKDTCTAGKCKGTPIVCPTSKDPCDVSACTEATKKCTITPAKEGATCDDGDPCTSGEVCTSGKCGGGGPTDCSKLATDCTSSACVAGVGCQPTNINEGMPCDVANVCAASQCTAGVCTQGMLFDGMLCDDGLFCTDPDACGGGKCVGQPKSCPGASSCVVASCDEASKMCSIASVADGTACDDGDPCTAGTTCMTGNCTPAGSISSCVGGDQCCPPACSFANDSDCKPTCTGYADPGVGGCWYVSALGDSCASTCAAHGGYNAAASTHTGNPICTHFFPAKAGGSNWMPTECCSTDNNTNWGATGDAPDPNWVFASCYVACSCVN